VNAREIALSKVKTKKISEKEAAQIEKENTAFLKRQGKKLSKQVEAVLLPFEQDFTIIRSSDTKKWSSYGWYAWEFRKHLKDPLFHVVLRYETHSGKFSDDTDEIEWSEWYVTVQVPNDVYERQFGRNNNPYAYRGTYDHVVGKTVMEDFSCHHVDELEQRFGEYMARWYE
jgi:hypothetical protein